MHDKNAGFTMVEMCLVLAIVTILLAVFSLPVHHVAGLRSLTDGD